MAYFIAGQIAPGNDMHVRTTGEYNYEAPMVEYYQHENVDDVAGEYEYQMIEGCGKVIDRFDLRQLFTLAEKVAVDNVAVSVLSDSEKAMVVTILKDFESTASVHLSERLLAEGLMYLESVGLIGVGRAAVINSGAK